MFSYSVTKIVLIYTIVPIIIFDMMLNMVMLFSHKGDCAKRKIDTKFDNISRLNVIEYISFMIAEPTYSKDTFMLKLISLSLLFMNIIWFVYVYIEYT